VCLSEIKRETWCGGTELTGLKLSLLCLVWVASLNFSYFFASFLIITLQDSFRVNVPVGNATLVYYAYKALCASLNDTMLLLP
jgi:hypothetical protein